MARTLMSALAMRAFLLMVLLAGCGAAPVLAVTVPCGDTSCGPGFYCEATCDCCGAPSTQAPSGHLQCKPVPAGCVDLCSCPSLRGGACDASKRLVEYACPGGLPG